MHDDINPPADELDEPSGLSGHGEAIRLAREAGPAAAEEESLTRRQRLLEVMNSEIWPLLHEREPIEKAEREHILGLHPSTGI